MRKDIVEKVARFYKERLSFYDSLKKDALAKAKDNGELINIKNRLNEIKVLALKGKLDDKLDREYDELKARFNDIAKDYLPNIKYECELCKDRGVVGGKYCKCFKARYNKELKKASNICDLPKFTFEDSSISDFMLEESDKAKYSKVYNILENYANSYPNVERRNIFLRGQSGSGKTCLISAVANRLIERDIRTEYITAFDLSELMLANHLDYKNHSLADLTNVDVLVIDDLGSEPMRENVNKSYLQSIIDSRIVHNKAIIITTNLTAEQLMRRYGERVISRLLNKSDTISISFDNTPNLRTTKRK